MLDSHRVKPPTMFHPKHMSAKSREHLTAYFHQATSARCQSSTSLGYNPFVSSRQGVLDHKTDPSESTDQRLWKPRVGPLSRSMSPNSTSLPVPSGGSGLRLCRLLSFVLFAVRIAIPALLFLFFSTTLHQRCGTAQSRKVEIGDTPATPPWLRRTEICALTPLSTCPPQVPPKRIRRRFQEPIIRPHCHKLLS